MKTQSTRMAEQRLSRGTGMVIILVIALFLWYGLFQLGRYLYLATGL